MAAIALAEAPARYDAGIGGASIAAPAVDELPGEPAITAAWLLGRVPASLLPAAADFLPFSAVGAPF